MDTISVVYLLLTHTDSLLSVISTYHLLYPMLCFALHFVAHIFGFVASHVVVLEPAYRITAPIIFKLSQPHGLGSDLLTSRQFSKAQTIIG